MGAVTAGRAAKRFVRRAVDPRPTFYFGNCDDVGLGPGGMGKVRLETKITRDGIQPERASWVAKPGKACPGWSSEKQHEKPQAEGAG